MNHKSKEAADFFIAHLDYLFSLSDDQRYRKGEYRRLREVLRKEGYWRGKRRGISDASYLDNKGVIAA